MALTSSGLNRHCNCTKCNCGSLSPTVGNDASVGGRVCSCQEQHAGSKAGDLEHINKHAAQRNETLQSLPFLRWEHQLPYEEPFSLGSERTEHITWQISKVSCPADSDISNKLLSDRRSIPKDTSIGQPTDRRLKIRTKEISAKAEQSSSSHRSKRRPNDNRYNDLFQGGPDNGVVVAWDPGETEQKYPCYWYRQDPTRHARCADKNYPDERSVRRSHAPGHIRGWPQEQEFLKVLCRIPQDFLDRVCHLKGVTKKIALWQEYFVMFFPIHEEYKLIVNPDIRQPLFFPRGAPFNQGSQAVAVGLPRVLLPQPYEGVFQGTGQSVVFSDVPLVIQPPVQQLQHQDPQTWPEAFGDPPFWNDNLSPLYSSSLHGMLINQQQVTTTTSMQRSRDEEQRSTPVGQTSANYPLPHPLQELNNDLERATEPQSTTNWVPDEEEFLASPSTFTPSVNHGPHTRPSNAGSVRSRSLDTPSLDRTASTLTSYTPIRKLQTSGLGDGLPTKPMFQSASDIIPDLQRLHDLDRSLDNAYFPEFLADAFPDFILGRGLRGRTP